MYSVSNLLHNTKRTEDKNKECNSTKRIKYLDVNEPKQSSNTMQSQWIIFLTEIEKSISTFTWNRKGIKWPKQPWKGRIKLENSYPLTLKFITELWQLCKNRYTDQLNRTHSTEIYPHIYRQLIFRKDAKSIQWRKYNL